MRTRLARLLFALALLLPLLGSQTPTHAAPAFADPAFGQLWQRTDSLVAGGAVKRSYYWGPTPNSGPLYEDYAEGVGGKRLVQYFDKSRMEINNPNGERSSRYFVTNGLLTRELISGQMQVGDNKFVTRWPAEIPIAGDAGAFTPTYADFANLIVHSSENRVGQLVYATVGLPRVTYNPGVPDTPVDFPSYNVHDAYYEAASGHNIPDVFWSYLNQSGPVLIAGRQEVAKLSDPYFYATGYPISEAYWAYIKVGGVDNIPALIQAFERRVLTYVPSAADGFKVQMGNVGQHYYAWRYQDAGKPPALAGKCDLVPVRGFGKLWTESTIVKLELGCPVYKELSVNAAQQSFQHGQMLGLMPSGANWLNEVIYVLFDDGTLWRFDAAEISAGTESGDQAPSGLYKPTGDFGKVWNDVTGVVRKRLGWATAPPITALIGGNSSGVVQEFGKGMMIYSGSDLKKIYVLYGGEPHPGLYGSKAPDQWAVYDDTYTGP